MKTVTKETTAESAFGKKLATPLKYSFSWKEYESNPEFIEARAELSIDEQRKARNNMLKVKARAASLTAALDAAGIARPTLDNDEQLRLKNIYDSLIANKMSHEQARETAAKVLGLTWADDDDE
jgi:hypothetical protein